MDPHKRTLIFKLCLLLSLGVAIVLVRFVTKQPTAGDEPHYLLMAESLIQDRDFNLTNDYAERRYFKYYPSEIPDPHIGKGVTESPRGYPSHGIALAILIAPAVWLLGEAGATLVLCAVAALCVLLTYLWVKQITGSARGALLAAGSLLLSHFFLALAGYIYPDLLISLLLLIGCLLAVSKDKKPLHYGLLGLVLAMLVWVHFKTLLFVGPLFIWVALPLLRKSQYRELVALGLPLLVSTGIFELVIYSWYGTWLPYQIYGQSLSLFGVNPLVSLSGMLFDVGEGLLANNPLFILIFPGLVIWAKQDRFSLGMVLVTIIPALLLQATFPDWGGGFAPPGRYLMEIVPLFMPALAYTYARLGNRFLCLLVAIFATTQAFLVLMFLTIKPRWTIEYASSPLLSAIQQRFGVDLSALWPSVLVDRFAARADFVQTLVYIVLIVLLMLYTARHLRPTDRRRVGRGT